MIYIFEIANSNEVPEQRTFQLTRVNFSYFYSAIKATEKL